MSQHAKNMQKGINHFPMPVRRFFTRTQAAAYLSICVDTFDKLDIPYSSIGRTLKRWDVADIDKFMHNKKSDWAPNIDERKESSWSRKNGKAVKTTISTGAMSSDYDIAKVLELPIKN